MIDPRALSRRSFLRRVLGAGVGLLSLEFVGGSLAFLWPNISEGLGASLRVGRLADILLAQPRFAQGYPYSFTPARTFLINVPAARALAAGREADIPAPRADEMIALWRKCPHLGCMVPDLCESVKRFECRCHGSTYNILGEKLQKGPAERGMDRFAVMIEEDGTVVVDTREILSGAPERISRVSTTTVPSSSIMTAKRSMPRSAGPFWSFSPRMLYVLPWQRHSKRFTDSHRSGTMQPRCGHFRQRAIISSARGAGISASRPAARALAAGTLIRKVRAGVKLYG